MEPVCHPGLADSRTWILFTLSPAEGDPSAKTPRGEKVPNLLREGSWSVEAHQGGERPLEPEDKGLECHALDSVLCCCVDCYNDGP